MAKLNTKNMSTAELKALKKELATSLKSLEGSTKLNARAVAEAQKAHTAAVNAAAKALAAAQKEHDGAVKAAAKTLDGATKALTKEAAKLTVQISAHDAKIAQVEQALANPAPVKAKAKATEEAPL